MFKEEDVPIGVCDFDFCEFDDLWRVVDLFVEIRVEKVENAVDFMFSIEDDGEESIEFRVA